MKCIYCDGKTKVCETRMHEGMPQRRRRCLDSLCAKEWVTEERPTRDRKFSAALRAASIQKVRRYPRRVAKKPRTV